MPWRRDVQIKKGIRIQFTAERELSVWGSKGEMGV